MATVPDRRKLIYVIDDEQVIARTLAVILQRAGYTTDFFHGAEQALKAAESRRPDLIVTDVMLTGMSGIRLAELVAGAYPKLPVLLISGELETSRLVADAKQRGFNFYVHPKPMLPELLLSEVAKLTSMPTPDGNDVIAA